MILFYLLYKCVCKRRTKTTPRRISRVLYRSEDRTILYEKEGQIQYCTCCCFFKLWKPTRAIFSCSASTQPTAPFTPSCLLWFREAKVKDEGEERDVFMSLTFFIQLKAYFLFYKLDGLWSRQAAESVWYYSVHLSFSFHKYDLLRAKENKKTNELQRTCCSTRALDRLASLYKLRTARSAGTYIIRPYPQILRRENKETKDD